MEPVHATHRRAFPQCHLGWKMAGVVAALVTCLLITSGLMFSLISAQRAMAKQHLCPQYNDDDKSMDAIRNRVKERLWKLSKKDENKQWLAVFAICTIAMVLVSLLVTWATLVWLKPACTDLFKGVTLWSSRAPEHPPPPAYNPIYPGGGGGVFVVHA